LKAVTTSRKIAGALILLGILSAGAWLRLAHTGEIGPRLWDEGIYLQEARFLYTFAEAVSRSLALRLRESRTGEDLWKKQEQIDFIRSRVRGSAPIFGRLNHDLAIALGMTVCGPDSPSVGTRVSALAGTLSLPVFFLLARRLYGGRAALLSTAVFSLLGYHIHYCRSSMAEATTLLFLLISFYFYVGSRTGRMHLSLTSLALAAFFLGLAFTTHNRMLVMLGMFLLYEVTLWVGRPPSEPPFRAGRLLVFLGFFSLPLLAWESLYYFALLAGKHLGVVLSAPTYLEQLVVATGRSALWNVIAKVWRPDGLLTFPYLLWQSSGFLPLLLAGLGLVLALRRRGFADLLAASWLLLPYVFYGITTAGLSRTYTALLPAAALLAGSVSVASRRGSAPIAAAVSPFAPDALASSPRHTSATNLNRPGESPGGSGCPRAPAPSLFYGLVLLAVLGNGLWTGHRATLSRDGYAQAARALQAPDSQDSSLGRKVITTNVPVLRVYLGEDQVAERPPASLAELGELSRNGFGRVLIDYNRILYAMFQPERVQVLDEIASRAPPAATIPNPFVREPLTVFEANLFFWDTLKIQREIPGSGLDVIRIYELGPNVK